MPTPGVERDLDEGAVLALDNIALELPLAGVGSRALAGAIDYFALSLLAVVLLLAVGLLLGLALDASPWVVLGALALLAFASHWGYFAGFEIGMGGRIVEDVVVLEIVAQDRRPPRRDRRQQVGWDVDELRRRRAQRRHQEGQPQRLSPRDEPTHDTARHSMTPAVGLDALA